MATIDEALKDLEKEEADTISAKKALHFKIPNLLRISCLRLSSKL